MLLKILCLNGQEMGDLVGENGDLPEREGTAAAGYWRCRRLALLMSTVNADVIGLVEAPSSGERTRAYVAAFLDDGYDVWQGERRGSLGLAFLVRRSLGLNVTVRSKEESLEDFALGAFDADGDGIKELYSWYNRVPLELVVSGGGLPGPMTLILVHAKSKGAFIPGDLYAYDRLSRANRMKLRAQAVAIRARLDKLVSARGEGRVVLMGDMNDGPEFDIHAALLGGAFLEPVMGSVWDPARVFHNSHAWYPAKDRWTIDFQDRVVNPLENAKYGNPADMRSWIDHILLSPELKESVAAGSAGILHAEPEVTEAPDRYRRLRATDHHPPYVTLDLNIAQKGEVGTPAVGTPGLAAFPIAGGLGERAAPDDVELLLTYVLGHKLDFTRHFLRSRKLPYSGTREQLRERLMSHMEGGRVSASDLAALLNQIEGWGNQHVYLYNAPAALAAAWTKQSEVEARLTKLGLADLLNRPRPLVLPDERTLAAIEWSPLRLRLVWVEKRGWEQRAPDLDRFEDQRDERLTWQAYRTHYLRGLLAFDWDIASGQALLSIQRLPADAGYDQVRGEMQAQIEPILPLRDFRTVRVSRAIQRIGASDEVRRRQLVYKTRRGSQATLISAERTIDAFSDPKISEAGELLEEGAAGLLGDFYWRTVDGMLSQEMHTKLYADDQRAGIFGEHTENDVRYVLSRIRHHSR